MRFNQNNNLDDKMKTTPQIVGQDVDGNILPARDQVGIIMDDLEKFNEQFAEVFGGNNANN